MSETKSFASLGPMLLARKGTAKPAMKVQLGTNDRAAELSDELEELAQSQADLGWNDMGDGDNVVTFEGARRLQGHLASRYQAPRRAARGRATGKSGNKTKPLAASPDLHRAAFTLRLDAQRHLKLRLASTIHNCSAQVLVTQALDLFLEEIEELESLAEQISRKTSKA